MVMKMEDGIGTMDVGQRKLIADLILSEHETLLDISLVDRLTI
jgi:hypothetical protein